MFLVQMIESLFCVHLWYSDRGFDRRFVKPDEVLSLLGTKAH